MKIAISFFFMCFMYVNTVYSLSYTRDAIFTGTFINCYGVAVGTADSVYVTDASSNKVFRYSLEGEYLTEWATRNFDDVISPRNIAVDASGTVYVIGIPSPANAPQVYVYEPDGTFVTNWGNYSGGDSLDRPVGIAVSFDNTLYIGDGSQHIHHFTTDGSLIERWSYSGLHGIRGIGVDSSGFVYVSDEWNHRMLKFTFNGTFVTNWGSFGSGPGQFDRPSGVGIDSKDRIFVSECGSNDRIQAFDTNGTYLTQFNYLDLGYGDAHPDEISIDSQQRVYIVDANPACNGLIYRYREYKPYGELILVNGATGEGSHETPYDFGETLYGNVDSATLRLSIVLENAMGLTITRSGGSTNFWASGLSSIIGGGTNDNFAVFYQANGVISTSETATFTIESTNNMAPITFFVKASTLLNSPTDIFAGDGKYTNIVKITWNASTGAEKYIVYRNTVDNSGSASDISGEITSTSFEDTTANPCEIYYYWVKAGCNNGWSDFSESDSGYKRLSIPMNVSASDASYTNKIEITWNTSTGATKYKIYRNTVDNSDSASDISGEVTGTSFEDTTTVPGIKYYYWTKAGCDATGWSDFSDSDSGYAKLALPINISATDGTFTNKIVITWSTVFGATGYEIYRDISNNPSNAILLTTSESNKYSDTSIDPTTKYYYWVKGTSSACNSELSTSDSGYVILTSSDDGAHGKWKYKSKNGKAKLKVKGMGMTVPLANYLEDGCLIGLKDASNNETVDGPHALEPLKKKKTGEVKKWQYIEKKVAIIKYIPKSDKLIYKVWQDLPTEIIFFVQPPMETAQNAYEIAPVFEIYLRPGETVRNGWRKLMSTTVEDN
ncbi:MAG: hypothetical protein DRI44_05000 [Chlamydiae bacterium]|nr:MAG: hypothetical protein DRI44_05000 [Chlamydiota bacterium]